MRSRNHCCRAKAINITHSECVFVDLVIHQALPIPRIVLQSVARLPNHIFPRYLKKARFSEGVGS